MCVCVRVGGASIPRARARPSKTWSSSGAKLDTCVYTCVCVRVRVRACVLGGWVNPHREQQTIPQGQTSSPPKSFFTSTVNARPDQAALATSAEARGETHRAWLRSPALTALAQHITHSHSGIDEMRPTEKFVCSFLLCGSLQEESQADVVTAAETHRADLEHQKRLDMNRIPYCILRIAYSTCRAATCYTTTNSVDRQNQTHTATHNICGLCVPRRRCPVVPYSLRLNRESEQQAFSCVLTLFVLVCVQPARGISG